MRAYITLIYCLPCFPLPWSLGVRADVEIGEALHIEEEAGSVERCYLGKDQVAYSQQLENVLHAFL